MRPITMLLTAGTVTLAIAAAYLGRELVVARAAAIDAARDAAALRSEITLLRESQAQAQAQARAPGTPLPVFSRSGATAPSGPGAAASIENAPDSAELEEQRRIAALVRSSFADRMQTPAMQRVFRIQLRTGAKRMYSDFAAEYKLTAAEAGALYDLIAKQQMERTHNASPDPQRQAANQQEQDLADEREVAALLGEARAAGFREYQNSFEARGYVAQLDEQLSGMDMPLSEEQRRRLVKAVLRDAEQFPQPRFGGALPQDQARDYASWYRERSERFTTLAGTVLTPQQMQQFQDLRELERMAEEGIVN